MHIFSTYLQMSILKSTSSGFITKIKYYFDDKLGCKYELMEKDGKYKILIGSEIKGGIVNIFETNMICEIGVDEKSAPYLVFHKIQSPSKYKLIETSFYQKCSKYAFQECFISFSEQEMSALYFFTVHYNHFYHSTIYLPHDYFSKMKNIVNKKDFIDKNKENSNKIYIHNGESDNPHYIRLFKNE